MVAQRFAARRDFAEQVPWHRRRTLAVARDGWRVAGSRCWRACCSASRRAGAATRAWMCTAALCAALVLLSPLRQGRAARCVAWLLAGLCLACGSTRAVAGAAPADRVRPDTRVLLEGAGRHRAGARRCRAAISTPRCGSWKGPEPAMARRAARAYAGAIRRSSRVWANAGAWLVRLGGTAKPATSRASMPSAWHFAIACTCTRTCCPPALNARLALAPHSIDARARAHRARASSQRVADPDAAGTHHRAGRGPHGRHEHRSVARVQCHGHHAPGGDLRAARHAVCACWRSGGARGVALAAARAIAGTRAIRVAARHWSAAGGYALLAGFSVPTQRTWLMLAVFALAPARARAAVTRRANLVAGADHGAAARCVRAAGRRLLAVLRGGGRHPVRRVHRARAGPAPAARAAPAARRSCWRSRR